MTPALEICQSGTEPGHAGYSPFDQQSGSPQPAALKTPAGWFAGTFPELHEKYGDAVKEVLHSYEVKTPTGEKEERQIIKVAEINEDFLADALGLTGSPSTPAVYLSDEGQFLRYSDSGIYGVTTRRTLETKLSDILRDCANACESACCDASNLRFKFTKTKYLQDVVKRAEGRLLVDASFFDHDKLEWLPCANGLLHLPTLTLHQFSPQRRVRNKLAVAYDPQAGCPQWERFIHARLSDEDVAVLQQIGGLMVTGLNLSQVVTLFIGLKGGEGKGTTVRVLTRIIGQENVAELRTAHLDDRFEMAKLRGKYLALGPDVAPDFLSNKTAQKIKMLTGGDFSTIESKNVNLAPTELMRVNVLITSNSRLRIRLAGDIGAWRRRLVVIEFKGDAVPQHKLDARLSERMAGEEGSGILNWMLKGHRVLAGNNWIVQLNDHQKKVRDGLLLESESHVQFAAECLELEAGESLTVTQAYEFFVPYCAERGWNTLTRNEFGEVMVDEVSRRFGITARNDVRNSNGLQNRGWFGLRISPGVKNQYRAVAALEDFE